MDPSCIINGCNRKRKRRTTFGKGLVIEMLRWEFVKENNKARKKIHTLDQESDQENDQEKKESFSFFLDRFLR